MIILSSLTGRARRAVVCAALVGSPAIIALATPAAAAAGPIEGPDASIVASTPGPPTAADDVDVIHCPIPDGSEFIDSWGASRSSGRRHQGVDMIAERGTPVVAAKTGEIEFKQSRLGGNAAWLETAAGDRFYYAHLDGFEGSSRDVVAGEVIGYVGSTGNAKGSHLHFETHFDGDVANPYPATFAACIRPLLDAIDEVESGPIELPARRRIDLLVL
jgi:murein DD-endopeptidase MepM/ murein hydrolase activator NlpD